MDDSRAKAGPGADRLREPGPSQRVLRSTRTPNRSWLWIALLVIVPLLRLIASSPATQPSEASRASRAQLEDLRDRIRVARAEAVRREAGEATPVWIDLPAPGHCLPTRE